MSPPSRAVAVALLVVGVLAVASVPGTGVVLAQDGTSGQNTTDPVGDQADVSFAAELQTDGDARWNITTTVSLDSESDIEAYRSTADDFEDGDLPPLGYDAFETGMTDVNEKTDREMRLRRLRRDTSTQREIENGVGRFTVEFIWENFLREADDELRIDRSVLVMQNGNLWFPGLTESQTLSITAPSGYGVRDSTVPARNGRLLWEGPAAFDETSLQATFLGTGNGSSGDDTTDNGPTERSGVIPWLLLSLIAVGITVAVLLTRRDDIELTLPSDLDVSEALSTEATTSEDTSTTSESTTAGTSHTTEDDEDTHTELLSDEERVERLLSSNGGRMKQANIVKETDWSNAKVSQLLSSMEEEGQIDKLRIGRENLISFPDEDLTDSDE